MANYAQTPASVVASTNAVVGRGTAGATITAGMPIYLDPADNKYKIADANGVSPLYKVAGIATNGASDGQPIDFVTEDPDFNPGCVLAVGDLVVLSATAGAIAPASDVAAGMYVGFLGVAKTTATMALKITRADAVKI